MTGSVLNTVIEDDCGEEVCMVFEMDRKVYLAYGAGQDLDMMLLMTISRIHYKMIMCDSK